MAINLQNKGDFPEALQAFQLGVKAGNESAASFLEHGFDGPLPSNELYYLGQPKDPERSRRYEAIGKVLGDYSYLDPKVPEIDAIVPLPPAPLPAWDGTLQWVKDYEANIPPPKPDDALIARLAQEKGLDPATGRPQKPKHAEAEPAPLKTAAPAIPSPLGLQLPSGATCPYTGTWRCSPEHGSRTSVFVKDQPLGEIRIAVAPNLWQRFTGEPATRVVKTTWTLIEVPQGRKA